MTSTGPIQRGPHRAPSLDTAASALSVGADGFAALLAHQTGKGGGFGGASAAAVQADPRAVAAYKGFIGCSAGNGQCVALARATNPALGPTAGWVRGAAVQGNPGLRPGTVIATFAPSGRYANATDGSSHTAIYLGQTAQGVQVLDQWVGSPAAVRTIPWSNPGAAAANVGSAFHVVVAG